MSNIIDYTVELELLREGDRSQDLFDRIINKSSNRLDQVKRLHERYTTDVLPIIDRCITDPMAINNTINNDFFSEIVDTKVGYFAGNPQNFNFDEKANGAADRFEYIRKRSRLDDLASETTKHCAIGGYSARLIYVNEDGLESMVNINPWEVISIGEHGIDEPEYAIRFYTIQDADSNNVVRMELHEAGRVTFYEGETTAGLTEDSYLETPFSKCSLYCYENNAELQGDAEKVLRLIDAYDNTVSDYSSELESFRSAYLALWGVDNLDEDGNPVDVDFSQSGTLYLKSNEMTKQDAKFITKQMQVESWKEFLDRTTDNIYRFSKTPNMKEESLGTAASGVALKFRLYPLENKTATFERKFVSGNIRMLECLADSFAARNIKFDPYEVDQTFTRNIPVDLDAEIGAVVKGKGYFPDEQLYSQVSFVRDAKATVEALKKQKQEELEAYGGVMSANLLPGDASVLEQDGTTTIAKGTTPTVPTV